MNEQDNGINAEMIVEFIICIIMGAMFFLPWLNILFMPVSGAKVFPVLLDVLHYSDYEWVAYLFLLLYLIPFLALICLIYFLAQNRQKMHKNFVSLCTVNIVELMILVLLGAYIFQSAGQYGQALMSLLAGVGTAFWILLGMSVFGLILAGVAGSPQTTNSSEVPYYSNYPTKPREYAPNKLVLFVIEGEYKGAIFQIPEEGLVIGSDPAISRLIIPNISGKHCVITYNANRTGLSITDYSTEGTFINKVNRLIQGMEYNVFPGQTIQLGSTQVIEVKFTI